MDLNKHAKSSSWAASRKKILGTNTWTPVVNSFTWVSRDGGERKEWYKTI